MVSSGCKSILIANRGEIACRIIRTCRRLGIRSIAVFSDADASAVHVRLADEAVNIGPSDARDSYLNIDAIVAAAKKVGADAVHPGYGFLSENAQFAERLIKEKILFIGPSPAAIRSLGDKVSAKAIARTHKVPLVPDSSCEEITPAALKKVKASLRQIGYPVIIKAAGGGGGRGMRIVSEESALEAALQSARREAENFFKDGRLFIEKCVAPARHIEVQIFGDTHGYVTHLFDRDCTFQRKHQKVIEEAPAPSIPEKTRTAMHDAAVRLGMAAGYTGAGTVEFLLDRENNFYFLEVNSRLQVEHPVTEAITGLDLVELQIRVARGESLKGLLENSLPRAPRGSAIEVRVCAESPDSGFVASTGRLSVWQFPETRCGIRVDSGFGLGDRVTHYYDSLLAKVIAWGDSRDEAIERIRSVAGEIGVGGVATNLQFISRLLSSPEFAAVTHHITRAEELLPSAQESLRDTVICCALAVIDRMVATSSAPSDSWSRFDGFAIGGSTSVPRYFSRSGTMYSVLLEPARGGSIWRARGGVVGASESVNFQLSNLSRADEQLRYVLDGVPHTASVYYAGNAAVVSGEFGCHEISLTAPALRQSLVLDAQSAPPVTSPLPGKIVEVKVKVGTAVKSGDILITIESMKMEHSIRASREGVVKDISVKSGDIVEAGKLLVTWHSAGTE